MAYWLQDSFDAARRARLNDPDWSQGHNSVMFFDMENPTNPADGKHVVIVNNQRVTGPMSQQEAQQEADKRNKLAESSRVPQRESQRAQVKQNIMG